MLRRRPLVRAAATTAVVAGTATAVSGRVARRQQASAGAAQQQEAPAEAAPAQAPAPDPIAQLKELAALRDQGILTEEEFAAQKAKILG
ncbi:MAG TPA: SHOCT domain-containing protein [Acidimicrobiales bacterium]|nr:SHOCT domain-containing protein [Acidimicrobiales bacterium]